MKALHDPESTRKRVLAAAFDEFYRQSFQAGSLNRIVEEAGLTKGALFHHFTSKQELGYAVVEEVIWPEFKARWIDPIARSDDPIKEIRRQMRCIAEQGSDCREMVQGCPLNNLAQEMSPLDEGFRQRLEKIYEAWRLAIETAFARAIRLGRVRKDVAPRKVAALIVAALTGIIGTVKNSHDEQLLRDAGEALMDFLSSLRS
jgi:AcrR family transcriptional regulator